MIRTRIAQVLAVAALALGAVALLPSAAVADTAHRAPVAAPATGTWG
ncbi:hypothetical protein [Streptacidiphilus neutrinimicus]|nr:hypothetical protein [Streptacidiphilus neutrinimicus]